MLVDILVEAFVAAFIAVAALGHVLLFLAIWAVWPDSPNDGASGGTAYGLLRGGSAGSPATLEP